MDRIQINLKGYRHLENILSQRTSHESNIEFTPEGIKFLNIDFLQSREISLNTAQTFTNVLYFENCTFRNIQDKSITIVRLSDLSFKSLIFKKCIASSLYVKSCPAISLSECEFESIEFNEVQSVELMNQDSEFLKIIDSAFSKEIKFDSLENLKRLRITGCTLKDNFQLLNNKYLELVKINNTTQIKGKTLIQNNKFSSEVEINEFITKTISFQRNNFSTLKLQKCTVDDLKISRNTGELSLIDLTLEKTKLFGNSSSHVLIAKNKVKDQLVLEKTKSGAKIHFHHQDLSKVEIINHSGESDLDLEDFNGRKLPDLTSNHFKTIHLHESDDANGIWQINGSQCTSFLIHQVKCHSLIVVFENEIQSLNVSNSTFHKDLQLNIDTIHNLSLDNCSIYVLSLSGEYVDLLKMENSAGEVLYIDINTTKIKNARFEQNIITGLSVGESEIEEFYFRNNDIEASIDKVKCVKTNSSTFNFYDTRVEELILEEVSFKSFAFNGGELKNTIIKNMSNTSIGLLGRPNENDFNSSSNLTFRLIGESTFKVDHCEALEFHIRNFEHTKDYKDTLIFNVSNSKNLKSNIHEFFNGVFESNNSQYDHWKFILKKKRDSNINVSSHFNHDYINSLCIDNSIYKDLILLDSSIETGKIKKSSFNNCHIKSTNSQDNKIVTINSLVIEDSCEIKNFELSNLSANQLKINNFRPQSFKMEKLLIKTLALNGFRIHDNSNVEFNFVNTPAKTIQGDRIEFVNCDLSGTNFNSCYFDSFEELMVKSSKLDKINCTVTTWPQFVNSYEDDSRKKKHQFEIREACRQLKLAMANHQDRVGELQFHALEMDAHRKIVSKTPWKVNDYVSLWAGATNQFGRSWMRPIVFLFVLILLIYSMILKSHYGWDTPICDLYWSVFNAVDYFQLFNPTHRINQLDLPGSKNGLTASFDFISRIISAFFIYQIVTAFRKFRK